jgi:hypothetical protein
MDDQVRAKLKALLAQRDRDELLDDPRRLAELVRERLGAERKREAACLNTVMQEGVPKRLLAMSASSITSQMLDSYARALSDATGLKEDIARSAVEAWADGLGMTVTGPPKPPPPPQPKPSKAAQDADRGVARIPAGTPVRRTGVRLIALVMAVWGAAILIYLVVAPWLFFDHGRVIWLGLAMPLLGAASVLIAFRLVVISRAARAIGDGGIGPAGPSSVLAWAAVAACSASALLCVWFAGYLVTDTNWSRPHTDALIALLFACVGTAVFAGMIVALLRRRLAPSISAGMTPVTVIAMLLLAGGLFGGWLFGLTVRREGIESASWFAANLPVALGMIVIGARMQLTPSWAAPRQLVPAIGAAGAVLYLGDIAWWGSTMDWEDWLFDLIGLATNLALLALAWRARTRAPAPEPRTA